MTKLLLVLAGGALGSLARYAASGLTYKYFSGAFPLGTLAVNLAGSFLIGLLWGLWETSNISTSMKTFVFIGILGGFTTFSAYSMETLGLFRGGEIKLALVNIFANNILGLLLVFAGFLAGQALAK